MKKTALVTGIAGQDGAYLAKLLLEKGYRVIGGDRRNSRGSLWRLEEIGILDDVEIVYLEMAELTNIYRTIEKFELSEIYNLAAQSFVSASFELPLLTSEVSGTSVLRMLEAVRQINPEIKFYQASTSEMFGKVEHSPQTEKTRFYPRSPYGVAKLFGHWMTVNYRESYGMFAVSGILFNHESPMRSKEFVSRKITSGMAEMKNGGKTLELGNLNTKRDWGFAGDYVEGMWLMLQQQTPDDYVLATGKNYSVRDFVNIAAPYFGFDIEWEGENTEEKAIDKKTGREIVRINPEFFRPAEVFELLGDSSKAKLELGWEPKVSFEKLVEIMCVSELRRNS
ncbi:MAG: GDP-mannose 4,6-dehydratase [Candidatus Mycalebacterium zealandia]|nr:MAG: GDP-mannose 4,6-dehydratase [Candidatus Mycalebacterium zealandia]